MLESRRTRETTVAVYSVTAPAVLVWSPDSAGALRHALWSEIRGRYPPDHWVISRLVIAGPGWIRTF